MGNYANRFPMEKKENGATPTAARDTTDNVTVASQFIIASEEFEEIGSEEYEEYEDFAFHQWNHQVNKELILLDNCSAADIVCNKKLITYITPSNKTLKIHCNSGTKLVTMEGTECGTRRTKSQTLFHFQMWKRNTPSSMKAAQGTSLL
jgi:hypothetical protein